MGEKKGNNGDEKNNNNGGEGINFRLRIKGVANVEVDYVPNKLSVIVEVDLGKPRDMVKTKGKKVEFVLPKENKKGGGSGKGQKGEGNPQKKADEKQTKDKEPPVTTAVIKLHPDCLGYIEEIKKIITKIKGYHDMSIPKQKNRITVKGTMTMEALVEALKKKLKKPVKIVGPKKEAGGN